MFIRPWLIITVAVLVFSVDRWIKSLAWAIEGGTSGGAVSFALFRNYGIAFSLPVPDIIYWPAAVAAAAFVAWIGGRAWLAGRRVETAAAFAVLAGAASNLIDRYALGYTVDYLIFFGISAVNLADALIVGGLAALVWSEATMKR